MTHAIHDYLDDLMAPAGPPAVAVPADPPAVAAVAAPAPVLEPVARAPAPVSVADNPLLPGHPVVRGAAPAERRRRADERFTSWLRFRVSGQDFAVEVLKVQEVLRLPEILPLRGTPGWMLGMMNLRGQIVPVTDLALRLGLAVAERDDGARVVVLEQRGEAMGLLVDAVADVQPVSDASIENLGGPLAGEQAALLRGVARRNGRTITLLAAERLLD